jgi:hypothetical protein
MKKITLILAFIGMITLQSCTVNQVQDPVVDHDTIGSVFEVTSTFNPGNNFSRLVTFTQPIYNSDMVLMYRLDKVINGTDVWKAMPQTYYYANGALDFRYDFDFTKYDVSIYMDGKDLATISNQYRSNQTFRIVVVPAAFTNKKALNYKDYNQVIANFGLTKTQIKKIF